MKRSKATFEGNGVSAPDLNDISKDYPVSNLSSDQSSKVEDLCSRLSEGVGQLAKLDDALKHREASVLKREETSSRKEEAAERQREEHKRREQGLDERDRVLKEVRDELNLKDAALKKQERTLEERESAARTGFARENEKLLEKLREEIRELELHRDEMLKETRECARQAEAQIHERERAVAQKEAELDARDSHLTLELHRLEAEKQGMEWQYDQIRSKGRQEAEEEIAQLKSDLRRAEKRRQQAQEALQAQKSRLADYRELEEAMEGCDVQAFLDEREALKSELSLLRRELSGGDATRLRDENKALRGQRDALDARVSELSDELALAKQQLSRLHLGVSDKDTLEKEKRALIRQKQILSARLNELSCQVDDLTRSQQAQTPFPQMSWMDAASEEDWVEQRGADELKRKVEEVPRLKDFVKELRDRIALAERGTPLYFRLEDVRLLLAGLSMSQLHIFQGISGTGKTSLAKAFAKAVGGHCTDVSVQAGWRDRDDLLGNYNAFEKRFYERDCLQGIYRAQTDAYKDRLNVILLDEMNLSHPEQYFAEVLSALEKNDPDDRLLSLSESLLPNAPKRLVEGRKIRIPENLWFIGTANHDETTREFADKTYDRAHVLELPRHDEKFDVNDQLPGRAFSYRSLKSSFDKAVSKHRDAVKEMLEDLTSAPVSGVLLERFGQGWGNRFERQALRFIPVYIEAGGQKEGALDYLLASRVFRRGKVVGRYDIRREDIDALRDALANTWRSWKGEPELSMKLLEEDGRRKERGA
ncbi:MAG: AAA family ATPase [Lautropia sp.]|nr:AAA family ATPase [Lautropia sp.]